MQRGNNIGWIRCNWTVVISVISGIILGLFLSWGIEAFVHHKEFQKINRLSYSRGQLYYTNPLLGFDYVEESQFVELKPMHKVVSAYIDEQISVGNAQRVSVYFRDLSNAHWMGVRENELYSPASLYKLPLAMAFYKVAEVNPDILQRKVMFLKSEYQEGNRSDDLVNMLRPGETYSIEELLQRLLMYSDNDALTLLREQISDESLYQVYRDLGVEISSLDDSEISPKMYALFLRILRNATYLNNDYSERILALLAKSNFKDGLTSQLPSGVEVAHKYGIKAQSENHADKAQFHDCGIIYTQKRYLLCVMTEGNDPRVLAGIVSEISKIVYEKRDE